MRTLRTLAATAVLLALAGCGQLQSKIAPPEPELNLLSDSVRSARGSGPARFVMKATMGSAVGGMRMTARGILDCATGRMKMSMRMPGLPGSMDMLMTGGDIFVHSDVFTEIPGVKPWLHLSQDDLGQLMGLDLDSPVGSTDASQALDLLDDADDEHKVGTTRIRGVETTHYRAVVDVGGVGRKVDMPFDAWVDAEGRPIRIEYSIEASQLGGALGSITGDLRYEMDFVEWDVPLRMDPPSLRHTTPFAEVMGAAGL